MRSAFFNTSQPYSTVLSYSFKIIPVNNNGGELKDHSEIKTSLDNVKNSEVIFQIVNNELGT